MEIRSDLKKLFIGMNEVKSKASFDSQIESFWEKYKPNEK
jgi:hypothetical protein